MRRSIATSLLFLVLTPLCHGQNRKLTMSGIVTDNKSHRPVEGATVTVVGNKANSDSTDRDGTFILQFSPDTNEGEVVRIRVEKTGYAVYEINKPASSAIPLQVFLEPLALQTKSRGSSAANVSRAGNPIENLARLGWGIKPADKEITFEIVAAPLPDMKESAAYLQGLKKPFQLHFQQVPSIAGLGLLSNDKNCVAVEISASSIESTSELRNLTGLKSLIISQTPFNDVRHELNIEGIASLVNLENLNLNMSRVTDSQSLAGLTKLKSLNIGGSLIRDMSFARDMKELKMLDVRDSLVTDISALDEDDALEELSVDEKQVPSLALLSRLPRLNKLTIISYTPVDMAAVGTLSKLTHLFIWGPPMVDLGPVGKLDNLTDLNVSGFGLATGFRTQVVNIDAIGKLTQLKTLTIDSAKIDSLRFLSPRNPLTELHLSNVPVGSVSELVSIVSLKKISFVDVPVVDISPLLSLPNLETLSLLRTPARADVIAELERRGVNVIVN